MATSALTAACSDAASVELRFLPPQNQPVSSANTCLALPHHLTKVFINPMSLEEPSGFGSRTNKVSLTCSGHSTNSSILLSRHAVASNNWLRNAAAQHQCRNRSARQTKQKFLQSEPRDWLQLSFTQHSARVGQTRRAAVFFRFQTAPPVHSTISKLNGMVADLLFFKRNGFHNFLRENGFSPPVRHFGSSLSRLLCPLHPVTLALELGSVDHLLSFLKNTERSIFPVCGQRPLSENVLDVGGEGRGLCVRVGGRREAGKGGGRVCVRCVCVWWWWWWWWFR